ncbi:hypothetical protein [Mesorhizobium sp. IMUNJ 23232]|uniref:hypothetical protein n=1 Tax=Mesorhizobium sp. IMUNJ 23232 TaxID=3376064 RepID=UPI0037A41B8E
MIETGATLLTGGPDNAAAQKRLVKEAIVFINDNARRSQRATTQEICLSCAKHRLQTLHARERWSGVGIA